MKRFMLDCSTMNLSSDEKNSTTNEWNKKSHSIEYKQIVLRSFEVISRIDPIQIYNSTIEQPQQQSIDDDIQPMSTSQLAELSIQRARFDIHSVWAHAIH